VERGDVVVFRTPFESRSGETIFVKRCIAVAGDEIAIEQGSVLVNGVRMPLEPGRTDESYGPVVVPKNHLFVMGDNRDHSYDSRTWGFLPEENVIGKATFIYWSVNKENGIHGISDFFSSIRWNRVGTLVH
jgi:signal peptidase I